ncbi:MAG: HipA domain-containing protein, partial [Myxococcaceae bacterium]
TLPLGQTLYVSKDGLLPFFDNLVAEGWLEKAQIRLLGKRTLSRFELLLAFGQDCAGAVSVVDPEPERLSEVFLNKHDPKEMSLMSSRASLSGIQPKIMLVEKDGKFTPAKINELSTHIAKFRSQGHSNLLLNEYITMKAFEKLLPDDNTAELSLGEIEGFSEPALIIKRFDRVSGKRIHFEEFNQLLDKKSADKYKGSHRDMADFMKNTKGCLPAQIYRLYGRILAGILLGNSDMHLKNFAMFHRPEGLRLTPSYDQVSAVIYGYKTMALEMGGATNLKISNLRPEQIIALGIEFGLSLEAITMLVQSFSRHLEAAKETIIDIPHGSSSFKNHFIKQMESRWNKTFDSIGQTSSKKL